MISDATPVYRPSFKMYFSQLSPYYSLSLINSHRVNN